METQGEREKKTGRQRHRDKKVRDIEREMDTHGEETETGGGTEMQG